VLLVAALAKFIRIRPVEEEKVGGKGFFFFLFFLFFFPFCWPNHRGNIKISYLLGGSLAKNPFSPSRRGFDPLRCVEQVVFL